MDYDFALTALNVVIAKRVRIELLKWSKYFFFVYRKQFSCYHRVYVLMFTFGLFFFQEIESLIALEV